MQINFDLVQIDCNQLNMGAFFLFDPCNSLIYSYYNQKFEHFLFEQFKLIKTETKNVVDVIHNLVQLHLTPYVSAHRESNVCSTQPQFDGLPNTILAHLNVSIKFCFKIQYIIKKDIFIFLSHI